MTSAATAPPKEHIYYGVRSPIPLPPAVRELAFFRRAPRYLAEGHPTYTGEGRLWHFQQALQAIVGKQFDNHEWSDACFDLFANYQEAVVTGPTSAGKTTAAAIWALMFWASSPGDTAVILTSTTIDGVRKRVWKETKRFFRCFQPLAPEANVVESKRAIQSTKNDDSHGIFCIAVAQGETEKAVGRLIGFHPKNLLIIIDEATDTPEAIIEACANLRKVAGEFQIILLGNAKSHFDPHGKAAEPRNGWASVTVEDAFWETSNGACLHLNGFKSPNIKAGKTKWPYLLHEKDIAFYIKKYGENSPKVWRFIHAFWPPDGLENTVLTETMALMFKVKHQPEWMRQPTKIAMLDPAFGGDRCIMRLAQFGECRDHRQRIQFTEILPMSIDADSKEPVDYQIARQAREHCRERAILPRHFGIDSTGSGRGVAAILQREWSPQIQVVEFSAAATDRRVSATNPKPCSEEYDRFVTELWFAFRRFVEADQIRGMDDDTLLEFYTRQYDEIGRGMQRIETKPDMKKRTGGVSPDLADAACIGVEVCRRAGLQTDEEGTNMYGEQKSAEDDLLAAARRHDFDALEECYTDGGV